MKYDAIIVGSGQSGNPLTQKLTESGVKVAIIEAGPLGGTCVNFGCTPTKTMVASAQVAHYVRNAQRWGVHASSIGIDMAAILNRKEKVVAGSRGSWEKKFEGKGNPRLYRGKARFTGERRIEVNGETLEGDRVFINTGASPTIPPIEGLQQIDYLTYVSILELQQVPNHLVILGGGYVGLEFGQMFRRFGSDVTVIQSAPQILPKEDEDIAVELQRVLESEGIRFHLNTRAKEVQKANGQVKILLDSSAGPATLAGSHVLVAAGRQANTGDLDLDKTGVKTDKRGFIIVDEYLKTTGENIWATGDVTGGPQFTHISYNDFQIVLCKLI